MQSPILPMQLMVMDVVNQAAFLQMHQLVKYVLGLKSESKGIERKPSEIFIFCKKDYTGDLVMRSVSGFVLYILGIPVSWISKAQRSTTVSGSEASCIRKKVM